MLYLLPLVFPPAHKLVGCCTGATQVTSLARPLPAGSYCMTCCLLLCLVLAFLVLCFLLLQPVMAHIPDASGTHCITAYSKASTVLQHHCTIGPQLGVLGCPCCVFHHVSQLHVIAHDTLHLLAWMGMPRAGCSCWLLPSCPSPVWLCSILGKLARPGPALRLHSSCSRISTCRAPTPMLHVKTLSTTPAITGSRHSHENCPLSPLDAYDDLVTGGVTSVFVSHQVIWAVRWRFVTFCHPSHVYIW